MEVLLRPVKRAVKQTPLWPVLRPRRIHVYGVGAPRTGTNSISQLFKGYRTAHEAHPRQTFELIQRKRDDRISKQEIFREIKSRDRKWRLECESAHFLIYLVEELVELFPDAKFLCTVRRPRSWLRSIIDQDINKPRAEIPPVWKRIHDLAFGIPPDDHPPAESVLQQYSGVRSVDQYLSYWAWHNERMIEAIPPERRLILWTRTLTDSIPRIEQLVGVPSSVVEPDRSHTNAAPKKHDTLQDIDEDYLSEKIDSKCSRILKFLESKSRFKNEFGM